MSETTEKIYKVRYEMLGKEGIVTITMDGWYDYPGALAVIKESISWMKSASIVKVIETPIVLFTENDFKVVIK